MIFKILSKEDEKERLEDFNKLLLLSSYLNLERIIFTELTIMYLGLLAIRHCSTPGAGVEVWTR